MASNDPGFSELSVSVSVRDLADLLSDRAYLASIFKKQLNNLFESSKSAIAQMLSYLNSTNLEICRNYILPMYKKRLPSKPFNDLHEAFIAMGAAAFVVAGPDVLDANLQFSKAEQYGIEHAFLAVVIQMRRQEENRESGLAPEADFEKELKNRILKLYSLLKATFEKAEGYELAIPEKEVQDFIEFVMDNNRQDPFFDRSVIALSILVGFIVVEMKRAGSRARDEPGLRDLGEKYPCPFYIFIHLYKYLGYRYHMISEDDYRHRIAPATMNRFTSRIGRAVILLSHAYRPKILENLFGVMWYFKLNLKSCSSLYYIKRFVSDSITARPLSSYRYMVLLCLISEITLALYREKENADPVTDYYHVACTFYKESGMIQYERMLHSKDNFRSLTDRAKILNKAWKTVSSVAIDTVVIKSHTAEDLLERYGDRLEGFELISPRSSPGDPDSEKDELEKLLHDDEDVSIHEYQEVSDYIDSGRKSPLPKAEQPEPEGESNLEGEKGASSAKGRKGPADVEGKSDPEDSSPTKRRKDPADIEGKSDPEDSSPTKRRTDPADVEGKSNLGGQKEASSAKVRKGPSDVIGKSNPKGQKDSSPTKTRKRPFSEAGECSPGSKSGPVDVGAQFDRDFARQSLTLRGQGLETVPHNLPIVLTGQRDESSIQSPLHPSGEGKSSPGKAEKSSPGVQPKPEDNKGESNTETPEDVPPTQGASQPKPKRKISKRKHKGKR